LLNFGQSAAALAGFAETYQALYARFAGVHVTP
jgi:hypothetical protein